MSTGDFCRYCQFADPTRKTEDGKIRCKRFSKWVDPLDKQPCYVNQFWETLRKEVGK